MEILQPKANQEDLNNLHGLVAQQLAKGLDDPKTLAIAVKFLKDNEITATILESNEVKSITASIREIAEKDNKTTLSVEDMMKIGDMA